MFQNIDLLFSGIAIAAILILGFVVFFNNKKSLTNKTFLFFSFAASVWNGINYFSSTSVVQPEQMIWVLRLGMFAAIWYSFFLFQLFYIFPKKNFSFSKKYLFIFIPGIFFVALFTLTPFVFPKILMFSQNGAPIKVETGKGIIVFGITVVSIIAGGLFILLKKIIKAKGSEKIQYKFILLGASMTFFLHIIFNFIFPAFLRRSEFVSFGSLFTLPFVIFTTYAIIKHHLFAIKIVATEIITFILIVISFVEILFSTGMTEILLRVFIFFLLLVFGILLIKSVLKEVKQREVLEKLTKDLENANRRLAELVKLKSEFLSIASHQLRTPTSIAKGMLSMVLDGTVKGAQREDFIEKSFKGVIRLERIIRDLLNASELEGEKMKLECRPVDIQAVVKAVIEERKSIADKKGLTLTFKSSKNMCSPVMADQVKIVEVVANLIDNAINYTEKGSIVLWCEHKETKGMLELHIKDTGIGISREDHKKLFKKFSRGERSPGINPNGSGLGLFIVKKIAEGCGGSIEVKSKGINKGSEFIVSLRLA